MARPKKTIRTIYKNIGIPEDLAAKMELELYSEVEGKIPFGAQQEFLTKLLRAYFDTSPQLSQEG
jgi:hypothetical protein